MQNFKKLLPLICIVAGIISGCQFTTSYTNREADKKDAQKVTDAFYADMKANKTEALYGLFSKRFYEVTPKDSLTSLFDWVAGKCGEIRTDSISDWQSKITKGTTNESDYLFEYGVVRSKHNSKEQIRLSKEPDGTIKIIGYHVSF